MEKASGNFDYPCIDPPPRKKEERVFDPEEVVSTRLAEDCLWSLMNQFASDEFILANEDDALPYDVRELIGEERAIVCITRRRIRDLFDAFFKSESDVIKITSGLVSANKDAGAFIKALISNLRQYFLQNHDTKVLSVAPNRFDPDALLCRLDKVFCDLGVNPNLDEYEALLTHSLNDLVGGNVTKVLKSLWSSFSTKSSDAFTSAMGCPKLSAVESANMVLRVAKFVIEKYGTDLQKEALKKRGLPQCFSETGFFRD